MGAGVPEEIAADAAGIGDPRRIGGDPELQEDQLDYDREGISAGRPGIPPSLPPGVP